VMLLKDHVAQAALRAGAHYIDIAGLFHVKEGMLPHSTEIENRGLSFVVSVGWMPGLSD
jgi:saccharopine dehydrogenase-like NADP-dependent oxidoreductase